MSLQPASLQTATLPIKRPSITLLILGILTVILALAPGMVRAQTLSNVEIPPAYDQLWLDEVAPFVSASEREAFGKISGQHARQAFKRAFWVARDTAPHLAIHPLRQRFLNHLISARLRGLPMTDPRSRLLLLHGPPAVLTVHGRCGEEPENRILATNCVAAPSFDMLDYGSVESAETAPFLFVQNNGACVLYDKSLEPAFKVSKFTPQTCTLPGYNVPDRIEDAMTASLGLADTKIAGLPMVAVTGWEQAFLSPPERLGQEPTFALLLQFEETGRDGNAVYSLDSEFSVATPPEWNDSPIPWRNLYVRTDIFDQGRHVAGFDHYELEFPRGRDSLDVQLALKAPAGQFVVVIHVEDDTLDLYETAAFDLNLPAGGLAETRSEGANAERERQLLALTQRPKVRLANNAGLAVGIQRLELEVLEGAIDRVEYRLDGTLISTETTPPFSSDVELDQIPRERRLEVRAYGGDQLLATDHLSLNPGVHRFSIDLSEASVTSTEVALTGRVLVPSGARLRDLELFADGTKVLSTTDRVFQYRGPPTTNENGITLLKAQATLVDGRTATATRLASPVPIETVDVDLVEVFVGVVNRAGRPITDLKTADFRILEDGALQTVRTFTHLDQLPINVVLLLDTSSTMKGEIQQVRESGQLFLENILREEDLAAILSFNHRTFVVTPFTNDKDVLAEASESLTSWGGTSLLDSTVLGLHYLQGLEGKKALVLVSDGVEETSGLEFEQLVEYADRVDASVYTIALGLPGQNPSLLKEAKVRMKTIAQQTGGASFRAKGRKQIEQAYREIENDLRSQYLLTYESSAGARPELGDYRKITLDVRRSGAKVRARPGYYP